MSNLAIPVGRVALMRGARDNKPLYSLQYGPSRNGEEIVRTFPLRQGFCLVLSDIYPEYEGVPPLAVQYYLRPMPLGEDSMGMEISKPHWTARKEDFIRSACGRIATYWRIQSGEEKISRATIHELLLLAQQAAHGCHFDAHIFSVSDAVVTMSDPFYI